MVSEDNLVRLISNINVINAFVEKRRYYNIRLYEPLMEDGQNKINFMMSGFMNRFARFNLLHGIARILDLSPDDMVLLIDSDLARFDAVDRLSGQQVPLTEKNIIVVANFLSKQFGVTVPVLPQVDVSDIVQI